VTATRQHIEPDGSTISHSRMRQQRHSFRRDVESCVHFRAQFVVHS